MSETENSIRWEMVLQQQLVNVPEYMKQNEKTGKKKKGTHRRRNTEQVGSGGMRED